MLKRLRFQLTALYILAALGLVVLTGLASYSLVRYYFERETDLALEAKMAIAFRSYGLIPPPELVLAERSFSGGTPAVLPSPSLTPSPTVAPSSTPTSTPTFTPFPTSTSIPTSTPTAHAAVVQPPPPASQPQGEDHGGEGESEDSGSGKAQASGSYTAVPRPGITQEITPLIPEADSHELGGSEGSYENELSSIYVLPLNASGQAIAGQSQAPAPFTRNDQASLAAMVNGYDWRTVSNADGSRVRLLTYRLANPGGPAVLQLGRLLTYEDRVLSQFLVGLLVLGAITSVLLGMGSWWLSGRSLSPAQKAWDQQQAFVSNASHELRTPLTLIRATAEVGLREGPGGDQQEYLQGILDETDYMNRLVDDLLLLSRLDAHRLKLAHESIPLAELLEDTARQAQKLWIEKGIQVVVGEAHGAVWGDRTRLRQVLLILLDNALRFTPPAGRIQLDAPEPGERRKTRQVMVSDNGSGIPAEHLPHVFERFYQAGAPGDSQVRTNGLGLSIAKGLIEAQGGEIRIQSSMGQGTRVTLVLPSID